MNRQEIIDGWNAQADEYNQWDDLGEDEKLEWAMQMEREACAKVCDELHVFGSYRELQIATLEDAAAAIRARGNT